MGGASGGSDRLPAGAGRGSNRIRGANRHTDPGVYETVTLVTHAGRPLASRSAATREARSPQPGRCSKTWCKAASLDALHTTRDTERAIVETHGADYLFTVKGNCPDTLTTLAT